MLKILHFSFIDVSEVKQSEVNIS